MRIFLKVSFIKEKNVKRKLLVEELIHTPREFPPDFQIKTPTTLFLGYATIYNQNLKPADLLQYIKSNQFHRFNEIIGEFVLFYLDFAKGKITVLTDSMGQITVYSCRENDTLLFSLNLATLKKKIPVTLNWHKLAEHIIEYLTIDEQTIFKEINILPPSCYLTASWTNPQPKIFSYFDLNYWRTDNTPEKNVEKFRQGFLDLLHQIIVERLTAIGNLQFAARLSSGLDSTLINYLLKQCTDKSFPSISIIAPTIKNTDPKEVIVKFAQKHNLKPVFFDGTQFYIFADNHHYLQSKPELPIFMCWNNLARQINKFTSSLGVGIVFHGTYHEDLYNAYLRNFVGKYQRQTRYFFMRGYINKLQTPFFTEKFYQLLQDKKYFLNNRIFPMIHLDNVTIIIREHFTFDMESNLYGIHPYLDPRLVNYFVKLPQEPNGERMVREVLLGPLNNIYIPGQISLNAEFTYLYKQFLNREKSLCLRLLDKSHLHQLGLINKKSALDILKSNIPEDFIKSRSSDYLANILLFEYYFQSI